MTNSNQVSRTYPAAISADGHYLAYRVNNPTSPVTASLYLRNMVSRTTQVTTAKSALPIGTSDLMHVSADGRYIAYTGKVSTSLPAYATYVYDMATGVSEQADVTLAGAPVRNPTGSFSASMSADGGVVAFLSSDVALTAPPAPAGVGVYVRTRLAGQTEFISGVTRGRALSAVVSPNGRYVGFIVDPASGAERAVYVYDRLTKNSRIIPGVFINSTAASSPVFSADGRYLAFDALNGKTGVRSIGVADLGVAAGLTIAGAAPSLTEGGAAGTYTVALAQVPNASVTVTVAPDKQLSVARTQLVFTPENWNVPQVVSVQALQDGVAEGQHSGVVTHTVTSADIRLHGGQAGDRHGGHQRRRGADPGAARRDVDPGRIAAGRHRRAGRDGAADRRQPQHRLAVVGQHGGRRPGPLELHAGRLYRRRHRPRRASGRHQERRADGRRHPRRRRAVTATTMAGKAGTSALPAFFRRNYG